MERSSSYSPPVISDTSSSSSSCSSSSQQVTGYSDYCMPLSSNQGYPYNAFSCSSSANSMPSAGMSSYCSGGGMNTSCLSSQQYSRTYPFGRYAYPSSSSNSLQLPSCAVESPNYVAHSYTQQEVSPTSTLPPSPQSSPPHSYSPSNTDENSVSKSLYADTTHCSSNSPQSTSPTPAAGPVYRTAYNGMAYSSLPLWTPQSTSDVGASEVDNSSTNNSYHLMNSCSDHSVTSSSYYPLSNGSHYNYSTNYPNCSSTSNIYYSPSYSLGGGTPAATDYTAYQTSTAFALWNYPSFQVSPVSKVSYDSPRYKLTPERAIPLIKWFEDHKDHPYPSRHEKMVLCQSTQLTFTQVSTWFANARRRLKKAAQDEEDEDLEDDESLVKTDLHSAPINEGVKTESKLLRQ